MPRTAKPDRLRDLLDRAEPRSIAEAYEIGRAVVEDFYGGAEAFRSRSAQSGSLRGLAEQLGGSVSTSTLWRAAASYLVMTRAPFVSNARHLKLSHVYAVLDLSDELQPELLLRAERERWTSDQLRSEVRLKSTRRRSGVRPSQAEPLSAALRRLTQTPLPDRRGVSPEALSALLVLVDSARDRIDAIRAWIAATPKDD